ncbi:protein of unknown function [Candidatus Promineifilum breve]|uniref:Uncharacterized protein n=1 Tax=Candidatus Promineifilum breve TaxID=1806508 RepID=A0A160T272_9CHLR|nr:protein of unknown function [Candidatus Promineifilum breve]
MGVGADGQAAGRHSDDAGIIAGAQGGVVERPLEQPPDQVVAHPAAAAVAHDDLLVVAQRQGTDGAFKWWGLFNAHNKAIRN